MADETKIQTEAAAEAPAKIVEAIAQTADTLVKASAKTAKRTRAASARRAKADKISPKTAPRRRTSARRKTRTAARKTAAAQQRTSTVTNNNFFNGFDAVPSFAPFQSLFTDANVRGAGKGLLVQSIGQIVLGREMPVSSYAHDSNDSND